LCISFICTNLKLFFAFQSLIEIQIFRSRNQQTSSNEPKSCSCNKDAQQLISPLAYGHIGMSYFITTALNFILMNVRKLSSF